MQKRQSISLILTNENLSPIQEDFIIMIDPSYRPNIAIKYMCYIFICEFQKTQSLNHNIYTYSYT